MITQLENSRVGLHGPFTDLTPEVEIEDLPSKWIPYPPESRIFLRKYTGLELRYLSDSKISEGAIAERILDGIRVEGFDKDDLTFHDYMYLALERKLISLDTDKFTIKWYCNKCNNVVESSIDSSQLEFSELKVPSLPIVAKLSFGTYEFYPITIGNHRKMLDSTREIDPDPNLERIKVWVYMMSYHLKDLSRQEELYTKMNSIGTDLDIQILEEVDKKLFHSIDSVHLTCPHVDLTVDPESDIKDNIHDLHEKGIEYLLSIAKDHKINVPETISFDFMKTLEYIDYKLHFIKRTPCNNRSLIRLSGSENLISPFRGSSEFLDNYISFGKESRM